VLVHAACDVSPARQPGVVQLDVEGARRDLGNEAIKPVDAPLDVGLPSCQDLDRRPLRPR
jgi:hypothetical protein